MSLRTPSASALTVRRSVRPSLNVELDGYRRVLSADNTLSQASDELVAMLAS